MEPILGLIVGGAIGLIVIQAIINAYGEYKDAQRTEEAKRKKNDAVPLADEYAFMGYDSSGRHFSTHLEELVESDSIDIQKIENSTDRQKELDLLRKKRIKRTCRRPYH